MGSELTFRSFEEQDWGDLVRFYEEFYKPGYIFTKREFFDWNFAQPPKIVDGAGQHLILDGKKVIGILGGLPWPLQIKGRFESVISVINLYLDPNYRGRRLGQKLVKDFIVLKNKVMGIGVNPQTFSLYERLGKLVTYAIKRFTRPINPNALSMLMNFNPRYKELTEKHKKHAQLCLKEYGAIEVPSPQLRFKKVERFDDDWDEAWNSIRPHYGYTTWRSAQHLNWRYINYPYPLYECYLAYSNGQIVGLAVLRNETSEYGPIIRLIDYVTLPQYHKEILSYTIEYSRNKGAILIDYFAGGLLNEEFLEQVGFYEPNNRSEATLLPMDFNPIRNRDNMQMFAVFSDRNDPKMQELIEGNYYFVKGDSDQDRAN